MTPTTIDQAMQLAMQHHKAGRLSEAQEIYEQIVRENPGHAAALNLLGVIAGQRSDQVAAIQLLKTAIEIRPNFPEAYNNLGVALGKLNQIDEAIVAFQRAVQQRPDYGSALGNLISACSEVIKLRPHKAAGFNNRGLAFVRAGRLDEAISDLKRALELSPGTADIHSNLGNALLESGRNVQAITSFETALQLDPHMADAHWNLSQALLLTGDWKRGWAEYEWRRRTESHAQPRALPFAEWTGEDPGGQTILLRCEQGFGDCIQMVRYASLVSRRGGRVIVESFPELARLFETCPGVDRVVKTNENSPAVDLQCPLLSLSRIFGTDLDSVPQDIPYLRADPELATKWKARMTGSQRKIGLVWAGRSSHKNDRNRSIPIADLAPLAGLRGAEIYSLQMGEASRHARPVGLNLIDFTADLSDFAETAALIENLDLVISVDTAIAHLAGAMGKPVWVLLPLVAEWRWLLNRSDSPWYPTMRLFRQKCAGDWKSVVEEVVSQL